MLSLSSTNRLIASTNRPMAKPKKSIPAILPNAGLRAKYTKQLDNLIQTMTRGMAPVVKEVYKNATERLNSGMTEDASIEDEIAAELRSHLKIWEKYFSARALKISNWFANETDYATSRVLKNRLEAAGFGVNMKDTAAVKRVLSNIRKTQIEKIKWLPKQSIERMTKIVTRSVMSGRDMSYMTKALTENFQMDRRSASNLSRDQNNKATQAILDQRCAQLNIKRGIWQHVPGVWSSRPTHVEMNNQEFEIEVGIYDPAVGRKVKPGELAYCQCGYRIVLPDLGDD